MSDPVTNVEIEDVLSSIRRLVAQGGKPRGAVKVQENNKRDTVKQVDRFVLTPALRVAESPEEDVVEAPLSESEAHVAQFVAPARPPLVLTASDAMQEPLVHDRMSASERASLEATIAELEAAVTSQPDEWEPDGSEVTPTDGLAVALAAMAEAEVSDEEAAVESATADDGEIEDAEIVTPDPVVTLHPRREEPTFRHAVVEPEDDTDYGDELRENAGDDGMPIPDDLDETLAAYIAGGTKLDHEEMRQMVVDAVRQELKGDLGERITRNIRKLVRLEISRATSENLYD